MTEEKYYYHLIFVSVTRLLNLAVVLWICWTQLI